MLKRSASAFIGDLYRHVHPPRFIRDAAKERIYGEARSSEKSKWACSHPGSSTHLLSDTIIKMSKELSALVPGLAPLSASGESSHILGMSAVYHRGKGLTDGTLDSTYSFAHSYTSSQAMALCCSGTQPRDGNTGDIHELTLRSGLFSALRDHVGVLPAKATIVWLLHVVPSALVKYSPPQSEPKTSSGSSSKTSPSGSVAQPAQLFYAPSIAAAAVQELAADVAADVSKSTGVATTAPDLQLVLVEDCALPLQFLLQRHHPQKVSTIHAPCLAHPRTVCPCYLRWLEDLVVGDVRRQALWAELNPWYDPFAEVIEISGRRIPGAPGVHTSLPQTTAHRGPPEVFFNRERTYKDDPES